MLLNDKNKATSQKDVEKSQLKIDLSEFEKDSQKSDSSVKEFVPEVNKTPSDKGNLPTSPKKPKKYQPRSRFFCFLLYPDSAPEDFIERLETLDVAIAISPLHDKDVSEVDKETGEVIYKKPHYHVIYVANSPTTANAVRDKLQRKLGKKAVALVKICDSVFAYYKYLTHESKDAIAKKKHIYDKKDITLLNNFDVDRYRGLSKEEKEDLVIELSNIILSQKIANIVELKSHLEEVEYDGMPFKKAVTVIKSSSSFFRLCFDGVYQTRQMEND